MAPSSSPSTATSMRSIRRPRVLARNDIASKKNPLAGLALLISVLTLLSCGTAADSSSTCLERTSAPAAEVPVRSRPGRACNELRTHWVSGVDHDDGQTGSTLTRRADARRAEGKDQRHRERLEFGGEFALALRIQTRPADFDQEVFS